MSSAALRGVGITSPAGHDLDAFREWWWTGRASLLRPSQHLANEDYMPTPLVGEVPDWKARNHIPERKSIKLMFPRVQHGVAAALEAWRSDGGLAADAPEPPPARRAMYVACGLTVDEDWTFRDAISHSLVDGGARQRFDLQRFGREGQALLNPLWLSSRSSSASRDRTTTSGPAQPEDCRLSGPPPGPSVRAGRTGPWPAAATRS